jgi:hypothetical protein
MSLKAYFSVEPYMSIPDLAELLTVCEIHDRSAQKKTSHLAGFRFNAPKETHFELYNITTPISLTNAY